MSPTDGRNRFPVAPPLDIAEWRNVAPGASITIESLRGKVVVLYAFQMLCPGCVLHGSRLAKRLHEQLAPADLAVIGLHTVFEHHAAMKPVSLDAYLHEFQLSFPVGIDRHESGNPLPLTMTRYGMHGTPTFVLIDRTGRVRRHHFGAIDELALGVEIGRLLAEP
jgi:peroxiredoxin